VTARRALLLALLLALAPLGARAVEESALDKRVDSLAHELRCLVCQNQSLAESAAPLAVDLRGQIREQLERGASEQDVIDYMVARYGDFVLYRPPLKATTIALWLGPFALAIGGAVLLVRRVRRRREPERALNEAERARAAQLLE
jgi:cytochrome c-type biogenesis protein CcmH